MVKDERMTADLSALEGPLTTLINGPFGSETTRRMAVMSVGETLADEVLANMERELDKAALQQRISASNTPSKQR